MINTVSIVMEILFSILIGVGLSAACGFRIFVPMLVVAIAARSGQLGISSDFAWLHSDPALIALSVAVVLEILAYHIPCVDNFLDVAGAPAVFIAGSILTASFVTDVSPWLQWSLGVILGGGSAGIVHAGMATVRGIVTTTTAGIGNGFVSTGETAVSAGASILALTAPILAILGIAALIGGIFYYISKRFRNFRFFFGSRSSKAS